MLASISYSFESWDLDGQPSAVVTARSGTRAVGEGLRSPVPERVGGAGASAGLQDPLAAGLARPVPSDRRGSKWSYTHAARPRWSANATGAFAGSAMPIGEEFALGSQIGTSATLSPPSR